MKDFFKVICEEGSITKAAARLYVSQPSLSMSLKRLEEELGVTLIDRSCSPLRPTEAGRLYLETYRQVESLTRQMLEGMRDLRDGTGGSLTVGAAHFITSSILLRLIKGFRSWYPKIRVSLVEGSSAELGAALTPGEIDLLLDYDTDEPGIERIPLSQETVYLAVPRGVALSPEKAAVALSREEAMAGDGKEAASFDFEGITSRSFVTLKAGNHMHKVASTLFARCGIEPKIPFETDQLATAYRAAVCGIGMTLVTDRILREIGDGGAVCYFRLPAPLNRRTLSLFRVRGRYLSYACRRFISFAEEKLGSGVLQ